MYIFDIETLGLDQASVVLSMGCVYVDSMEPQSYGSLMKNQFFAKLDVKRQIQDLGRTTDSSTMDWWKKQADCVKQCSLIPQADDLSPLDAINALRAWVFSNTKQSRVICYTRGSMDVMVTEHLAKQVDTKLPWQYNDFRDVRTAVDILYPNSKDGYVAIDPDLCLGYNESMVIKHDPVHDAQIDAAMILYGKR